MPRSAPPGRCGERRPNANQLRNISARRRSTRVIDHVTRCDPSVDLTKAAKDAAVLKAAGDLAPEGVLFIPTDRNPTKRPLVVTCNEVSGTTTVWAVGPAK